MNSMTSTTDSTTNACPSWCAREHLRDDVQQEFHHDSARWLLMPAGHAQQADDPALSIHTAQFVPEDGAAWAPVVELGPEGGESWRLSPEEAQRVADTLTTAAARATEQRTVHASDAEADAAAPKVMPTCPDWCNKQADHEYDSTTGAGEDLAFHRYHSSVADWDHEPACRVEALETYFVDSQVEVDTAAIAVYSENRSDLTPKGARILARQLLEAAELLERITGRG
jgi:hypothetical protein